MYKLVIEDDEGKTTVVPLVRDEITIGRKDGNTIRLTERNISRFHAKLIRSNGIVIIEDLDSYNGVKVNGDRISGRSQVKEGDVIEIGDYHLQLRQESDLVPVGAGGQTENTGRYSMDELARKSKDDITPIKMSYPEPKPVVEAPAPAPVARPVLQESTAIVRHPAAEAPTGASGEEGEPIDGASARLVVISQQFQGREFLLNKTSMHMGRTDDNDIALDHRSISKNHAKVILEGSVYKIIDLKSANGVLVNGEQYAKTELKNGDVVELGHIKFRFVDRSDAEAYSPETQHTAVIHRSQISRKPSSGLASPAPRAPVAAAEEREEMARAERTEVTTMPKAGGKTGLIIGVAVGAILLGVVALYFAFWRGGETPAPAGHGAIPSQTRGTGKSGQLVEEAKALMGDAKWGGARNKLEQAAGADPANGEVRSMLAKANAEEGTKELYEKAKASANLNNWDDAWKKMNQIPPESYYSRMVAKELPAVKEKYIQAHLDQGIESARRNEKQRAAEHFKAVLELDDQHPVATVELRKLQGAAAASAPEKGSAKQSAEPVREKQPKAVAQKEKPAEKEKTAEKEPPPQAAPAELGYIDYYNEGNKLYLQNRIVEAVSMFQKCIKSNGKYPNCHRSLGIAYAKLGQGDKAAKEYKVYLSLSPDAPDRKQLQSIIDEFEKNK